MISEPQWSAVRICGHIARIKCNSTIYALNCKPGMAFLFTCLSVRRFCKINIQHYILSTWNFTLIPSFARKVSMCYKAWKQDYVPQTLKGRWHYFTFLSSQRLVFSAPQNRGFLLNGSYVFNSLLPKNKVFLKCFTPSWRRHFNHHNQHSHRQTNLQNC